MSLINRHYSREEVKNYEQNRKNKKWQFEQDFVEKFLRNKAINSVLDAPLGTNRFGNFIDNVDHIKEFIGLELSDDMLKFSKDKGSKKLKIIKHDLIKQEYKDNVDLVLIMRMLNLVETDNAIKILKNLLPCSNRYVIATLRYDENYTYIENKIHIQPISIFNEITKLGFTYEIFDFKDDRIGNYSIILMEKNNE